jgi:hypothetical protein
MIRRSTVSILLLCGVAFIGGLAASLAARSGEGDVGPTTQPHRRHPLGGYLKLDPERRARIEALDPTFFDDLATLRKELEAHRRELAGLLDSAESTNDEIRDCVERSIEAHNRLERRVLEHLLTVRAELTPEEQKRLFHSISKQIRGHGRGFGRHRGPGDEEEGPASNALHPWEREHRRGDRERPTWRERGEEAGGNEGPGWPGRECDRERPGKDAGEQQTGPGTATEPEGH